MNNSLVYQTDLTNLNNDFSEMSNYRNNLLQARVNNALTRKGQDLQAAENLKLYGSHETALGLEYAAGAAAAPSEIPKLARATTEAVKTAYSKLPQGVQDFVDNKIVQPVKSYVGSIGQAVEEQGGLGGVARGVGRTLATDLEPIGTAAASAGRAVGSSIVRAGAAVSRGVGNIGESIGRGVSRIRNGAIGGNIGDDFAYRGSNAVVRSLNSSTPIRIVDTSAPIPQFDGEGVGRIATQDLGDAGARWARMTAPPMESKTAEDAVGAAIGESKTAEGAAEGIGGVLEDLGAGVLPAAAPSAAAASSGIGAILGADAGTAAAAAGTDAEVAAADWYSPIGWAAAAAGIYEAGKSIADAAEAAVDEGKKGLQALSEQAGKLPPVNVAGRYINPVPDAVENE